MRLLQPPRGANGRASSAAGWSSRLAIASSVFVLFQGLTGLVLWLGPFSLATQLQLLLHVAVGLAFLLPCLVYLVRHFRQWWRQRATAEQLLGYALAAAVLTTGTSGAVLTWQAWTGPALGKLWDDVHLISGLAAIGLLLAHVPLAFLRRRPAARRQPDLASAQGRFLRYGAAALLATVAAAAALALSWSLLAPPPAFEKDLPPGYALPAYASGGAAEAEYRGNPFAPTYARTASMKLVEPRALTGSASCGTAGCHEQVVDEWEPSAHRFAALNPPFQAVQRSFAVDRSAAETRYCAGCHDPISLFAGAKDLTATGGDAEALSAPGLEEGISCAACHSISAVDRRGNADYVLTPPRPYLWDGQDRWRRAVHHFLLRAYPRQHLADYDRPVLRSPELCGACHKQFIPEALNRFGLTEGQNQYDEWRNSHWHTEDPATDLSCRDCHMRLVTGSTDPSRGEAGAPRRSPDDGAHRHHGFIATNSFMPELLKLPHWREHVRLTEEWLRGETVIPEIAHLWPEGPVAGLELLAPATAEPGSEVELRVLVTNRKAGHHFTTGPLDFVRSWVHLKVLAADGTVLAEWGALDPESRYIQDRPGRIHAIGNPRDEGTLVLEALPLDAEGRPLRRHQLWRKAGGMGKRVIFPRHSDSQLYRFRLPPDLPRGPLRVEAVLLYRRYRQEFLELALPGLEEEYGTYQPVIPQAKAERILEVGGTAVPAGRTVATGAAAAGAAVPEPAEVPAPAGG